MTTIDSFGRAHDRAGRYMVMRRPEAEATLDLLDEPSGDADILCEICGEWVSILFYRDHQAACGEPEGPAPYTYPGVVAGTFGAQCAAEVTLAQQQQADILSVSAQDCWSALAIDFGDRCAEELFDYFDGDIDRARCAGEQEWRRVAPSAEERDRLISAGFRPSDFVSDDPSVRRRAHAVRHSVTGTGAAQGAGTSNPASAATPPTTAVEVHP